MFEWFQLVFELISDFSWPLTAITITLIFREKISLLLDKISKLSAAGLEAEFDVREEIAELKEEVSEGLNTSDPKLIDSKRVLNNGSHHWEPGADNSSEKLLKDARKRVKRSPKAAMTLGRVALDNKIENACWFTDIHAGPSGSHDQIKGLVPVIGRHLVLQVLRVRQITDHVDISSSTKVNSSEAEDLLEQIEILITQIQKASQSFKSRVSSNRQNSEITEHPENALEQEDDGNNA